MPTRRNARGPGPLKIVPTQPSGDIDRFSDHIEAGQVS